MFYYILEYVRSLLIEGHHLKSYDGPECPVLHAKFQCHRPSCSVDDI